MPSALSDAALALHKQGLHVFPVDHPDHPDCIGKHDPDKSPCDGTRGKHPACKWGTWAVAATPQMIEQAWDRRGGLANIGISFGPSGLVVLDEDAHGELDRWCTDNGVTLPPTYEVATDRGRHLYFRWDHSKQRIGNREKAMADYKINVRGDGGYAVGGGSKHESGAIYIGNGQPIADLPQEVADKLLADTPPPPNPQSFFQQPAGDPNATMIPDGERHHALVEYAGRLRGEGLDYAEAQVVFHRRWLLCEQPDGQIPEAKFHTASCRFPVTWEEAKTTKLDSVYSLYAAGNNGQAAGPQAPTGKEAGPPKRWKATRSETCCTATIPGYKNRIPRGAVTILCGDEGIGKTLLWVQIVVNITTGKPFEGFGIPARTPNT